MKQVLVISSFFSDVAAPLTLPLPPAKSGGRGEGKRFYLIEKCSRVSPLTEVLLRIESLVSPPDFKMKLR